MGAYAVVVLITVLFYQDGVTRDVDIHEFPTLTLCKTAGESFLFSNALVNASGPSTAATLGYANCIIVMPATKEM